MNDILLNITDLHAQYNTDDGVVCALNGVDISLRRGEVMGIVGETGAGKSTLALSILKLLPDKVGQITKGSITYDGIDILKAGKKKMHQLRGAKMSMIFQDPMSSLNPIITVGDQIKEVLDLHFPDMHSGEKEKRVDQMLELVGIQKSRKNDYPHQFSGGMKQRIGIAMSLIAEPELLLADEPTTALDVTIQAQILKLMQELKEQFNSAMIMITHDLGVVAEFCETVAVVYAGEIIEQGTVEELFSKEKNHPYTVGLFNSIPDLTSDAVRLVPIPGFMADPMDLPKGCKFAQRCEHCENACKEKKPDLYGTGSHKIRCFRYKGEEV
ncbi:ABC transporter ATP-binding protein [Clostridium sp. Marseille-P2415]|uniref:ABC transporter ATP-binding protein n=1 Tax=Clostridium sp. Marseille-P2415 TaxID=1805471 RepID=UPI0009886D81|nr:ABC transporter ATP-binding protein [Clostridium sp. Marseille-P2415]